MWMCGEQIFDVAKNCINPHEVLFGYISSETTPTMKMIFLPMFLHWAWHFFLPLVFLFVCLFVNVGFHCQYAYNVFSLMFWTFPFTCSHCCLILSCPLSCACYINFTTFLSALGINFAQYPVNIPSPRMLQLFPPTQCNTRGYCTTQCSICFIVI